MKKKWRVYLRSFAFASIEVEADTKTEAERLVLAQLNLEELEWSGAGKPENLNKADAEEED